MSDINYIHVRDNLRRPVLTVAYRQVAWVTPGEAAFHVGWAAKNPTDHYSKQKGRIIAAGRMLKALVAVAPLTGQAGVDHRAARARVLRAILNEVPTGARRHLERRIQALETPKAKKAQTVNGLLNSKGPHTADMVAIVRDEAVYVVLDRYNRRQGPLPLSWLTKQIQNGEWTVTMTRTDK